MKFTILKSAHDPVRMNVNGKRSSYPVGEEVEADDNIVEAMKDAGIVIRKKGEAGTSAPTVSDNIDPGFYPDMIIEGNIEDVEGRLANLTADQLEAVRNAEVDREKPRKGALDAIDAAIASLNGGE